MQPNFLSGIYGGITMAQYRQIRAIPGVQVAAPIAMVGYTLLSSPVTYSLPAAEYGKPGRQLLPAQAVRRLPTAQLLAEE